ncbi:MAG: hypothetical protein K0S27_1735, partial [Gammaproteobacteria bacterium]|nr:hypothetical protein [Gammaproteobacteria bacterium]
MQRRALSLLTRQRPYSQTPEEDEAVLDQWLHRKSMGYICKSTPYEWLMRWFPRCEIDASTVHLYMGQLNDEIQAHQRLPTGFMGLIKLLIGW